MRCINDQLIQKYIDKESSEKENSFVQIHITTCSKCAEKVEERRYTANHIKQLIGSLNTKDIQVPIFQEPEYQRKTSFIRFKKVSYALAAACLFILFFVFRQKSEDNIQIIYAYEIDNVYNANLPLSEQEMVIEIIDSEGKLIKN